MKKYFWGLFILLVIVGVACPAKSGRFIQPISNVVVGLARLSTVAVGFIQPEIADARMFWGNVSLVKDAEKKLKENKEQLRYVQPDFADNGNGTISDRANGLIWVKDGNSAGCNNGNPLSRKEAVDFCNYLVYAGFSDWRLPTINELETLLISRGHETPNINTTYFSNTKNSYYLSDTSNVYNTAGLVVFFVGNEDYGIDFFNTYIRPVRTGAIVLCLREIMETVPRYFPKFFGIPIETSGHQNSRG